jgi:hypothetical protein
MARFRVSRLRAAFRDPYLSQALTRPTLAKEKKSRRPLRRQTSSAQLMQGSALRAEKKRLSKLHFSAPMHRLGSAYRSPGSRSVGQRCSYPAVSWLFPLSFTATTTSNLATPRALDQQLDCTHSFLDQLPLSPRPRTASIDPSADVESENPDGASAGACYCG